MAEKQKKFLDAEGVAYLWKQLSLEDYPNNTTLVSVINAIDSTKADKDELTKYLDTTGDTMTGPLQLTHNVNYGQDLPTSAASGEIFFLENTSANGNDYAEYRNCLNSVSPGMVVCEDGNDNVILSTERLQPASYVVSDTFGSLIGHYSNCIIALSGRVLVHVDEPKENLKVGDAVAAGPDGKAVLMTRKEIQEYPDRILGIICAIPDYEIWNKQIKVNGRVWIKV